MKRFGATWLTLAVLAALAAYFFWVELPQEKEARQEKDRSTRVVDFSFHDVTEFDYAHGDLHVHAKKDGAFWKLEEPLQVIGDGREIDMFLAQLEDARIVRTVAENPAGLEDYGLASPQVTLQITVKGKDTYTALIGNAAPIGHSVYLKLRKENRVVMIPGFPDAWHRTLFQLRSKNIVDYETNAVTEVDLIRPENTLHLKKQNDTWLLSGAVEGKGDHTAIEDLLNGIRMARIQAFDEETPETLEPYGLASPQRKFIVRDGEKTWELQVGNKTDNDQYHAKRASMANVFQIEKRLVDLMDSKPLELLDRHVTDVDPADITSIELHEGDESATLVRDSTDPEQWRMQDTAQEAVDSGMVHSLLFDLRDITAKQFVTFGTPEAFGLDKPRKTLTLHLKDGTVHTLKLGNANLDGQETYASRSSDGAVFVLDADAAGKLFRAPHLMRQRTLLKFNPDQTRRIEIESGGKVFELVRDGDHWKLTRPEALAPLKAFIGNDVLWTLSHLEYEKEIEADESMFQKPAMTVTALDAEGKAQVRLTLGSAVQGTRLLHARVEGREKPVTVQDRILSEIPHSLEKFRLALDSGK